MKGFRGDSSVRVMDMVWTANIHMSPSCPRCGSSNTKFCYYNNYSLTQPRYFCKGCRRYWTKGGSLRNVPVGGGCRKIRRCRSIRVSKAEAVSRASLGNGFGSNSGLSISPEGSHIDIALVYANYLNHNPKPKGELEMEAAGGGSDDHLMPNTKQDDPDIEFLCGNELLKCEFLPRFSAETQSNNENQMSHEGLGSTDTNHGSLQGSDGINVDGHSLPPFPNEEVAMWWLDSRMEMVMTNHIGFQESEFPLEVFGSEGQDQSFIIANWGDFDLPL